MISELLVEETLFKEQLEEIAGPHQKRTTTCEITPPGSVN